MDLPNPVWLNVGGESFCCSLETLTWHEETFFSEIGFNFFLKLLNLNNYEKILLGNRPNKYNINQIKFTNIDL